MFKSTTVTCESCGSVVRRKRHAHRHCSPKCRQAAYRRRKAAVTLQGERAPEDTEKRNAVSSGAAP